MATEGGTVYCGEKVNWYSHNDFYNNDVLLPLPLYESATAAAAAMIYSLERWVERENFRKFLREQPERVAATVSCGRIRRQDFFD